MIKNFTLLIIVTFFVACKSTAPSVRTTKSTQIVKSVPISKTQTTPKVVNNSKEVNSKIEPIKQVEKKEEVLEATSKVKVTSDVVLTYINSYVDVAKKNMALHGVPASISSAQAILESGAGTGNLCIKANNHFGIKCHKDWVGESVNHDDDLEQECFRKYENVLDSYQDHANFLKSRRWYEPLFTLRKDDYKGWANGLKRAGYATDPGYPKKLIDIIEKYQLFRYDSDVLSTNDVLPSLPNKVIAPEIKSKSVQVLHEVVKGDTLYSISKKYNVSIDELKKKNNIINSSISIGQKILIK